MNNVTLCLTSERFYEFVSTEDRGDGTSIELYGRREAFVSVPDLDPVPASRICYEAQHIDAWPVETLTVAVSHGTAPGPVGESASVAGDAVRVDGITYSHDDTGRTVYKIDSTGPAELASRRLKARLERMGAGTQFTGAARTPPLGTQGALTSFDRFGNDPLRWTMSDTMDGIARPSIRIPTRVVMVTLSADPSDATGSTTVRLKLGGSTVSGSTITLSSTDAEKSISLDDCNVPRGSDIRAEMTANGGHSGITFSCVQVGPL